MTATSLRNCPARKLPEGTVAARQDSMLETRTSLLERVRDQNDLAAWSEFVALYRPLLLGYTKSRGVQACDAEDVVQEVFVALMRALPSFALDKARGRFRSWLWQVTMSKIRDRLRREKSRGPVVTGPVQEPAVNPEEPDREWLTRHRQRILEYLLPQLKAQTQETTWTCFEEHILRGRSGVAVGAELGMKANTVCVNAARVLAKLRQRCAEYEEELGDEDPNLSE